MLCGRICWVDTKEMAHEYGFGSLGVHRAWKNAFVRMMGPTEGCERNVGIDYDVSFVDLFFGFLGWDRDAVS